MDNGNCVTCENCVHHEDMEVHCQKQLMLCKKLGRTVEPDFFCAYGEKANERL